MRNSQFRFLRLKDKPKPPVQTIHVDGCGTMMVTGTLIVPMMSLRTLCKLNCFSFFNFYSSFFPVAHVPPPRDVVTLTPRQPWTFTALLARQRMAQT